MFCIHCFVGLALSAAGTIQTGVTFMRWNLNKYKNNQLANFSNFL